MDYWDVSDHLTEINYANKIFYIVSIWQTLQFTILHSALANIQITYRSDSTFPSGDTWLRTDPQAGHYRTVISLYLPLTVSVNDPAWYISRHWHQHTKLTIIWLLWWFVSPGLWVEIHLMFPPIYCFSQYIL